MANKNYKAFEEEVTFCLSPKSPRELDKSRFLELGVKTDDFLKCLHNSSKKLDVLERQKVIRLIVKKILVGKDKITIKHSIPVSGANGLKAKSSYLLCSRVPDSPPRTASKSKANNSTVPFFIYPKGRPQRTSHCCRAQRRIPPRRCRYLGHAR